MSSRYQATTILSLRYVSLHTCYVSYVTQWKVMRHMILKKYIVFVFQTRNINIFLSGDCAEWKKSSIIGPIKFVTHTAITNNCAVAIFSESVRCNFVWESKPIWISKNPLFTLIKWLLRTVGDKHGTNKLFSRTTLLGQWAITCNRRLKIKKNWVKGEDLKQRAVEDCS